MSDEVYNYVGKATIWVCVNNDKCKVAAIRAIATYDEIEQRSSTFLDKFNHRLEQVEKQMETKADKVMVDQLAVEAGSLEGKVTNLAMDMSKINQQIDTVRDESIEKSKRRTNIVVRGLPENTEKEDQDLASELFKDIGCQQVEITSTRRLGREEGDSKMRPLRVILKQQETKDEILRNCETDQN